MFKKINICLIIILLILPFFNINYVFADTITIILPSVNALLSDNDKWFIYNDINDNNDNSYYLILTDAIDIYDYGHYNYEARTPEYTIENNNYFINFYHFTHLRKYHLVNSTYYLVYENITDTEDRLSWNFNIVENIVASNFDLIDNDIFTENEDIVFNHLNNTVYVEGYHSFPTTPTPTDNTDFSTDVNNFGSQLNNLQNHFGFVDTIKNNVSGMVDVITNTQSEPKFKVNVNSKWFTGELTIIDLSWYAPYKETGDSVICIFAYLAFLWNIFKRLPDIISGAGAMTYDIGTSQNIILTREKARQKRGGF